MLETLLNLIPKPLLLAVIAVLLVWGGKLQFENLTLTADLAKEQTHVAQLKQGIAVAAAASESQRADRESAARAAEQARAQRDKITAADVAGTHAELERLRISLKERDAGGGLHAPSHSGPASADATAPLADLLIDCANRYSELGEKADRHVSDIKTLMDAWPR